MKMDISQWSKLNKKIKISYSNRKFYKRYLYKVVYRLPGCVYFSMSESTDQLMHRIERSQRLDSNRSIVDYKALSDFFEIYQSDRDIRFRSEFSSLSIFVPDYAELVKLVTQDLSKYTDRLVEVSLVHDRDLEHIEAGKVILREDIGYKYKVTLRGGYKRHTENMLSLGQYLSNLGDEIKIGKQLLPAIMLGNKYLSAGYFYVNDPRIVDLITLIDPHIVRYYQEIVINPNN